jgi:uncharacterized protein (DUF608 family)
MKYGDGKMGSVNGMRPDGNVDITSMQSEEMWIGITASLASLMIYEVTYIPSREINYSILIYNFNF